MSVPEIVECVRLTEVTREAARKAREKLAEVALTADRTDLAVAALHCHGKSMDAGEIVETLIYWGHEFPHLNPARSIGMRLAHHGKRTGWADIKYNDPPGRWQAVK